MARQIVFDTETTGLEISKENRIVELGCVEMIDRKATGSTFHQYVNPERESESKALEVHGLTQEFLSNHPVFAKVVDDFMQYVSGAELVIHNASFDVGFINYELSLLKNNPYGRLEDHCRIIDTMLIARETFPGQRNTLDALCKRFGIDNSHRTLHGALLDSEILLDVYLYLTGGQTALELSSHNSSKNHSDTIQRLSSTRKPLPIIKASSLEEAAHQQLLSEIEKKSGNSLWQALNL